MMGLSPFPDEQIRVLMILLESLKQKYNIPAANFIGHGDVAPGQES
jgi:N-acetylmuramoyl-L-alanine amidase